MPIFEYSALRDNKTVVSGRIEAIDAREARKKIKAMNLLPTQVIDLSTSKNKTKKKVAIGALSLREKIDFTSTLEILTSTGIPIIETLTFIERNSDSKKVRTITSEFKKDIIDGSTLSESLEKYKHIFGNIYIGLVNAGEDSGELDKTLNRMLLLLKKQDEIKGKVVGALIYPSVVVMLAIVAVVLMLVLVFPAFDEMFKGMGAELPWVTRACMNAGNFMKKYWFICLAVFIVSIFILKLLYDNPKSRKVIDNMVLHFPLLSQLLRYSNFSNFIAVLQVAYEAGIPIVQCLSLANQTMDNMILKAAMKEVNNKVKQGVHLSVALKNVNQVPTMMVFMVQTGEQSGRLGDALLHCVNFIDKKLDSVIDAFTKLIEPILMIGIGILVGFLGLALYLPLFQSYQQ